MKINETNVTIMVTDMSRSIDFYQKIGFAMKKNWDNHYAMLTAPGLTIGLHPADEAVETSHQVSIGLMIDKIDDARSLLDGLGVQYHFDDGKSGKYVHFADPDGTAIYFNEPGWSYDD